MFAGILSTHQPHSPHPKSQKLRNSEIFSWYLLHSHLFATFLPLHSIYQTTFSWTIAFIPPFHVFDALESFTGVGTYLSVIPLLGFLHQLLATGILSSHIWIYSSCWFCFSGESWFTCLLSYNRCLIQVHSLGIWSMSVSLRYLFPSLSWV